MVAGADCFTKLLKIYCIFKSKTHPYSVLYCKDRKFSNFMIYFKATSNIRRKCCHQVAFYNLIIFLNIIIQVWIKKPVTSKAGNSEVYVVCLGFQGIDPKMLDKLKENYGKIMNIKHISICFEPLIDTISKQKNGAMF